jgi:hypothetical protein
MQRGISKPKGCGVTVAFVSFAIVIITTTSCEIYTFHHQHSQQTLTLLVLLRGYDVNCLGS